MIRAFGVLAGLAATGLLLAGCAVAGVPRNSAGQITAPATIDSFQIVVGDCTGSMKDGGDVGRVEVMPCDQSHYFEAYAKTDLPDGNFPGDSEVTKQADKFCTAEFNTFVGVAAKDSSYDMYYLYPVQESWATGDREVLCLAGAKDGGVTGSLKGVAK
ncbi:MAG: septum formation family protein [Micropruina sp.]|uniref:septum formation family protein n=1 Tax=Micropruina sp. TaxID=2737536 RepID=UPI0039E66EDB